MTLSDINPDVCVCCGASVPEGWMVCAACEENAKHKVGGEKDLSEDERILGGLWKFINDPKKNKQNKRREKNDEKGS